MFHKHGADYSVKSGRWRTLAKDYGIDDEGTHYQVGKTGKWPVAVWSPELTSGAR